MSNNPRVPYDVDLGLPSEDEIHFQQTLLDVLATHAEEINRLAITRGSATHVTTFVISEGLHLCDATAASFTAFLQPAANVVDQVLRVKKVSSNTESVHIHAQSGETVDGTACIAITQQWTTVQLVSDGQGWYIV